jgi:hypothetical protein
VHRFVASDPDRGVHDHPWRWAFSLILAGWYLEERRYSVHVRRWFNWLSGDTFHRVVMPEGARDVWTLFVHGGRVKPWGFMRIYGTKGTLFEPYAYTRDVGEEQRWWETAPKGHELRHSGKVPRPADWPPEPEEPLP